MEERDITEVQSWEEGGNVDRYADLPNVTTPKLLLQAPCTLPPLFPFSRTTVYFLMSPESAHKSPKSVVLRDKSPQGPLELEIPVQKLSKPGNKLHQLAAKEAIQELEEGRDWLLGAKDEKNTPLEDRYPSCFDEMVQREAVRLGVRYQVGGKFCSFVAVADNDKNSKEFEDNQSDFRMSLTEEAEECESDEDMGFGLLEAPTRRYIRPKPDLREVDRFERTGGKEEKLDALGCQSASMDSSEDMGFRCMSASDSDSGSDDDDDDGSPMEESTFMRCKVNPTPPASTAVHHVLLLLAIPNHRPVAQLLRPAQYLPHSPTASMTQETANGPYQK